VSAWDSGQIRTFAKQIATSDEGCAWWAFPAKIRNAILSHYVLMIVLTQRGSAEIHIDDVRELRVLIQQRLADHHNLTMHT
jgi:hypothetical protein